MWYRFEEGNPKGIPRIKNYHLAWYDMTRNGSCFDESFFEPNEIGKVMPYVETVEDEGKNDRARVFVHFDDGDTYELKLVKIDNGKRCSNFYD
jgi:hypothetical protein